MNRAVVDGVELDVDRERRMDRHLAAAQSEEYV
jgi:hypothetical protein